MILDLDKFLAGERPYWKELETVLDRLENDPAASPSFEELQPFLRELEGALGRQGVRLSLLDSNNLTTQLTSLYLNVKQRQLL